MKSNAYRTSGVDVELSQRLLSEVKTEIQQTYRPETMHLPGNFGGLFELNLVNYKHPVLVSSIDGVGTKLLLGLQMDCHNSIGKDIVHHCINDIACHGAEPLYFLDYIGIGRLKPSVFHGVLQGIISACKEHNVTLLGGETAEMPGMYGNTYDIAGAITGVVEKERIISGKDIVPGDILLGLASNGLHTNGYTLARDVFFAQHDYTPETILPGEKESLGKMLIKPHRCYWSVIREALDQKLPIHGIAHITGGGIYDNVSRILPPTVDAFIERTRKVPCPRIFSLLQEQGNITDKEMYQVFNMGIGMVWVVPKTALPCALSLCTKNGVDAFAIGTIIKGKKNVRLQSVDSLP